MSKTGAVRKMLGPMNKRLSEKVTEANDLLKNEDHTEEYLEDLQMVKTKISKMSDTFQKKMDEWQVMLEAMVDKEEMKEEEVHYDKVCDEYISLLFDAEECQLELDRRMRKLTGHSKGLVESQASTPVRPPPGFSSQDHDHQHGNHQDTKQHGDHQDTQQQSSSAAAATGSSKDTSGGGNRPYSVVKTPKMTLPRFSGNYMEWKEFWSLFESSIHLRPDFTNVERFTYLRGQLDGAAKQAISGIMISEDLYDSAVAALKERFDRADDRLISLLYSQLKRVPPSGSTTESRQGTLDVCNSIFRQLESAGEDINSNRSLTIDLLSKFPAAMVRDLQRYYHVGPNSSLQDVRSGLKKSIQEWELTAGVIDDLQNMNKAEKKDPYPKNHQAGAGQAGKGSSHGGPSARSANNYQDQFPPSAPGTRIFGNSALAAMQPYPPKGQMPAHPSKCYFCDGEHFNNDCGVYPSASKRVRRLLELKRCSRCLKPNHAYNNCNRPVRCFFCKSQGHHVSALCHRQFPDTVLNGGSAAVTLNPPAPDNTIQGSGFGQFGQAASNSFGQFGHPQPNSFGYSGPDYGQAGYAGSNSFGQFGSNFDQFGHWGPDPNSFGHAGQFGMNSGQAGHSSGQAGHSSGQAGHSSGQAGHSSGQAGHSSGQAGHSSGQARAGSSSSGKGPAGSSGQGSSSNKNFTILNNERRPTLFQTAKVTAQNPTTKWKSQLRMALDTMSSRSYITESAAHKLGLFAGDEEKLYVSVFGSSRTYEFPTREVKFNVLYRDGGSCEVRANTTRVICNSSALPERWSPEELKVLQQLKPSLADDPFDSNGQVDILIGADLVWDFINDGKLTTEVDDLYLIPSKFGLMLAGQSSFSSATDQGPSLVCILESVCNFPSETGLVSVVEPKAERGYPDVDEFMKLDRIGISDDPVEDDDDKAIEMFQDTIKFADGRYHATLPWIEEKKLFLTNNYDLSYDRFRSLCKRLADNQEAMQAYRDTIALQKERQIIEAVPQDEIFGTNNTVHYLPHHIVAKPSSNTTKYRIVYDAAARKGKNSLSLNQCLLRGPVILPELCQILMRMRFDPFVVISDIEKAFLQVGLQECDRDVTRFLWLKDDSNPSLKDNIQVFRFRRVAFGIISSPFLLAATIDHHLAQEGTEFATSLRKDIYVDNVISTLKTDEGAVEYYHQLKAVFQRAGMNIQEFCSNSSKLMSVLPAEDKIKQADAKVLGLRWDSQGDDTLRLILSSKMRPSDSVTTKRHILQALGSVFDPLGFFQPVILNAKFVLRDLWLSKAGWDDNAPEPLQERWRVIHEDIQGLFDIRIPRFIGPTTIDYTLAIFCDASGKAYAISAYLRARMQDGSWVTNLLFSKSRLAPSTRDKHGKTRDVTLPRLELLGVYIGAKAGQFCRKSFPDARIDFFTDSECVMHWIQSRAMLKRFVDRRVTTIRSVKNCEFHHVSSGENPADLSTRGVTAEEIRSSTLWWHGPSFLIADKQSWPKRNVPSVSDEQLKIIQAEMKPAYLTQTMAAVVKTPPAVAGIVCTRFSSFSRLIRVTIIVIKFIQRRVWDKLSLQTKSRFSKLSKVFTSVSESAGISAEEYGMAKSLWVEAAQLSEFEDIIEVLSGKSTKRIALISQLGLILDSNGVIRSDGRFKCADLKEQTRIPVLLPRNQYLTGLIVMEFHCRAMHAGVDHTLSELRSEFWVPQGRIIVKKHIRGCLMCRKFKTAMPFKLPQMPSWPRERMARSIPFQYCGLDYFGPILVNVNGDKVKMWVCLFTCMVVRAVHLEVVTDCSSEEFLNAFIRFVCRRGKPDVVVSDNAAQFRLVKILGDKAWTRFQPNPDLASYAAKNQIRWKFITELAPWQGGFYERLVGIVKSTLKTSIGRRTLSWTDLVTLLCEAEAVVNSRPITHVGDDPSSRFRVLRPIDFLCPTTESFTDLLQTTEVSNKTFGEAGRRLVSVWKARCKAVERLWRIWYEEYLLSLRERQSAIHRSRKGEAESLPFIGQIVLIYDPDLPRGRWQMARVQQVFKSRDGKVRSAEVTLPNGYKIKRAINHLAPIEVPLKCSQDSEDNQERSGSATANSSESPGSLDLPPVARMQATDALPPAGERAGAGGSVEGASQRPAADTQTTDDRQPAAEMQTTDALPPVGGRGATGGTELDEEDQFFGFSADDVKRAETALRLFDDASNNF